MINILHLTHTDILHDSRILKEMQSIANSDYNYKVYGIGIELNEGSVSTEETDGILVKQIVLKSKKLTFLPTTIRHLLTLFELSFKMFFKAIKIKPKVIHCHDTLVLPLGVLLKFFNKAKLIYDAQELESNRNGLSLTLSKMTLLLEKIMWEFIDYLIVVSPSIEKWYKNNIGEKKSEIILNSPITSNLNKNLDKNYLRNKFSIPKESKIFLYIGILGRGRGIDIFLDVFKNSNINSHLIFCGYGELKYELDKIVKEFSNIHMHDAVPHERVVGIAQSADVGLCFIQNVSLSDYYCLPNKLFEYCFSEIPVLASDFPDISNIVKKYNLGKCSALDFNSIYITIKEFETMEKLPKINSEDLYNLSWKAQEDKLINLYSLLTRNGEK